MAGTFVCRRRPLHVMSSARGDCGSAADRNRREQPCPPGTSTATTVTGTISTGSAMTCRNMAWSCRSVREKKTGIKVVFEGRSHRGSVNVATWVRLPRSTTPHASRSRSTAAAVIKTTAA